MPFKHGRLAEILLNSQDVSAFMYSAQWNAYLETAKVSTFKSSWHSYIAGEAFSQLFCYGYYDPTVTTIRSTLQAAAAGVVSFAPAGATAIGDQVRMLWPNAVDYKESSKTANAVLFAWSANSTAPVGLGFSLHPLAQEALGTITGTGDGIGTSVASTTGAIGHLHVTQVSSAVSSSFKFQDATTLGGAYTDIASGAFTNVTAVGAQRLVIPGTIRQFVRCVAVIGPATTTYAVSFART
jgi:hypothetical protein